jgi:hypothetical protein
MSERIILSGAILAAILFAWTFAGALLLNYRPRWARSTSVSLASGAGDLADRYAESPPDLAGIDLSRLDDDSFLLQPPEWGSGTVADANLAGLTYAIVEIRGRHWTMDVRANAGYQLIGILAPLVMIGILATQHLPMPGRVGLLLFAALFPYAVLTWRRRVRTRFATAAQQLSAGQTDAVRAAARSL